MRIIFYGFNVMEQIQTDDTSGRRTERSGETNGLEKVKRERANSDRRRGKAYYTLRREVQGHVKNIGSVIMIRKLVAQ